MTSFCVSWQKKKAHGKIGLKLNQFICYQSQNDSKLVNTDTVAEMTEKKKPNKKNTKTVINSVKTKKVMSKKASKTKASMKTDFPVVGLGASAGGLEALEIFFSNMPSNTNMAFIVIQHLSPKHKSIMGSLLSKTSNMEFVTIENGVEIEPNRVYLNPPNKNVVIQNGKLKLISPVKTSSSINLPIDCFFRSMASELAEKAICIILSGTATDGTLGLKAIKGSGGIAMVQDPDSAKYDGMPKSAIATGMVDFILSADKLPGEVIKYIKAPYISTVRHVKAGQNHHTQYLENIFALIQKSTGHDLSHYKQTTISRRIERRMAVHQISKVSTYIKHLENNPAEVNFLFKDLLIGVTSFFRDDEVFKVLKEQVLPQLLKNRPPDSIIRIWIVGCSTGEEAYSLAILMLEVMEMTGHFYNIQVFASDIDADAVEKARLGIFPDSIAADVSEQRLRKYFVKEENTYRVNRQIRETVVFAVHNVIKDPPFSKIDLLSCRNLLIYIDAPLQKKILPLFHYTLKHDGVLLLGTSESIREFNELFNPISGKWKIFKKLAGSAEKAIDYPIIPFYNPRTHTISSDKVNLGLEIQNVAERVILNEYAPPGVLVNEHYEIVHFLGKTDNFLEIPVGKASFDILSMAREGLRFKLSNTLNKAIQQKKLTTSKAIQVINNGNIRIIDLTVRPLLEAGTPSGFYLVMFEEKMPVTKPARKKGPKEKKGRVDPAIEALELELNATKEHLQITIEELETSNEEQKSTNEELQSVNEELQSTNEELETSKEELQSTNEELVTVNTELQKKVDELSKANNDINNLLASTEIGTLFLDTNLKIKRFTPAATRIFNLIATDVGRSIGDITSTVSFEDLQNSMQHVLRTLQKITLKIVSRDNQWYSVQIIPYRTLDNIIDGVVLTFSDISEVILSEEKLRRLATVVMDSNDAITVQDFEGNIIEWNKAAETVYGYSETEALKMKVFDIIPENGQKQMSDLIRNLKREGIAESFKTQRITKNGKIIDVWLTATKLVDENGKPNAIATTERNISGIGAFSE